MVGSQCAILLLFILTTTFVEINTDKCESLNKFLHALLIPIIRSIFNILEITEA